MKILIFSSLIFLFTFITSPCQSAEQVIFNITQDYGGDALAIDPNNQIQLGAGLNSTLGISSSTDNSDISYLVSLGYKINAVSFPAGAVLFTTYPVNALVHYSQANFNIGIGISHHIRPTYRHTCNIESQCGTSRNFTFDSSVGTVFDYNYHMSAKSFIGLRYTSMKYYGVPIENLATNTVRGSLDVSHIGVQLGYVF